MQYGSSRKIGREGKECYMEEKPYRDLNGYYRSLFGCKIAKIALDGGFTCPNRDGTCGTRGCLFCSAGGSGDFAENAALSIAQQIEKGRAQTAKKWADVKYIAYFQAFTNTYAPVAVLRQKFEEALAQPEIVGLSIATRADCLPQDVIDLLKELSQKTKIWVEIGFQTANEQTAKIIHRGYDNAVFADAVQRLHQAGISVIVHTILGLPGETKEDVLHTMRYLNDLPIEGVKLQLLHVLENTDLAQWYRMGKYEPLDLQTYVDWVCACISVLREDIVIHRLTGDGDRKTLLAPTWSLSKRYVWNTLHKQMRTQNIRQGQNAKK